MKQCMDADNLHRRLKKIIGQVQAIDRMVDGDVPCEDILSQINAAKSALSALRICSNHYTLPKSQPYGLTFFFIQSTARMLLKHPGHWFMKQFKAPRRRRGPHPSGGWTLLRRGG